MSAPTLTHLDERGAARMVDVGGKLVTQRRALAEAWVRLSPAALAALRAGGPKGDALQVARIAGIQGAKRTADLVPLCHPLALDAVRVELSLRDEPPAVRVEAEVRCTGRTGVEMEALTAASVAALTVIDMVKAVDRFVTIEQIALIEKEGGRSGHVRRPSPSISGNLPAEPGSYLPESGGSAAHSED